MVATHNNDKEDYVWNAGNLLGCLLIFSYLLIKNNGTLHSPIHVRTANSPVFRNKDLEPLVKEP